MKAGSKRKTSKLTPGKIDSSFSHYRHLSGFAMFSKADEIKAHLTDWPLEAY